MQIPFPSIGSFVVVSIHLLRARAWRIWVVMDFKRSHPSSLWSFFKKLMQKFKSFVKLALSHFKIPLVLSVLSDNFIVTKVFGNSSFNLRNYNYIDLTLKWPFTFTGKI